MKLFSDFERICLKNLKGLEKNFGFRITKVEHETYGVFISYQNDFAFFRMSLEPREGGVFVSIGRLIDGCIPPYEDATLNWFDLRDLLTVRKQPNDSFRSGQWPSKEKLESCVREISNALETNAADVFRGEFKVFEELHQLVEERADGMAS